MHYEYHSFTNNESLKVFYHQDVIVKNGTKFSTHFHENIELLFMREGQMLVTVDQNREVISAGEIAIVPPNGLHNIESLTDTCYYDCLIIDRSLYLALL